jgi:hypothetical protein
MAQKNQQQQTQTQYHKQQYLINQLSNLLTNAWNYPKEHLQDSMPNPIV